MGHTKAGSWPDWACSLLILALKLRHEHSQLKKRRIPSTVQGESHPEAKENGVS